MDSDIYLKACELAGAIAKSPEAQELIRAEKRIREDKVANNLTERWKKVYEKIAEAQCNGQELTEQDERSIEFIEAKVENHPIILDFIDAHQKFMKMLEEVNAILSGVLTFEEETQDGCVTCPSKGKCGVEPNDCETKH